MLEDLSERRSIRPRNDWVLIELEEEQSRITEAGLHMVGEDPVRYAKVLRAGPGRYYGKGQRFVPTEVKAGERVCFFIAALQTKQGKAIVHVLPDNQGLIKESDILGVLEGDVRITR